MTRAEFLARFPEFGSTPVAQVESALSRASVYEGEGAYGDALDEAIGLRAAHLLALAPNGQAARLEKGSNKTTYEKQLDELRAAMLCGARGGDFE